MFECFDDVCCDSVVDSFRVSEEFLFVVEESVEGCLEVSYELFSSVFFDEPHSSCSIRDLFECSCERFELFEV